MYEFVTKPLHLIKIINEVFFCLLIMLPVSVLRIAGTVLIVLRSHQFKAQNVSLLV